MSSPLVSIVIPNYNYERFLEQRFDSILAQTCKDYELIVLDDHSTDNSVKFVQERFASHIAQLEVSEKNSGNPFIQWNRGVKLAKGEFIWIAEADDFCEPTFLTKMLSALMQSPKIGLAYCTTVPVDSESKVLNKRFHHQYLADLDGNRWDTEFTSNGKQEVRRYLSKKNTITNVSGVLFRRSAFVDAGFAPEQLRMCGDWMFYCTILRKWDISYVPEPLNFHRQHAAKHTQNSVLNLTYFREYLSVQKYVSQEFELSPAEAEAALNRFIVEWDRLTVSNYGRLTLGSTIELAQLAHSNYSSISSKLKIMAHFFMNSAKTLIAKCLGR